MFLLRTKFLSLIREAVTSAILILASGEYSQQLRAKPKIVDMYVTMSSICSPYCWTKLESKTSRIELGNDPLIHVFKLSSTTN
jgi:hypothetical protein